MKKDLTKHCSSYCDFLSASVRCVCFLVVLWSGLFLCVFVPGTLLAFHLLDTSINCGYLVYSVSQSVTTK